MALVQPALDALKPVKEDQKIALEIIQRAFPFPAMTSSKNTGVEISLVAEKTLRSSLEIDSNAILRLCEHCRKGNH